MKLVKNISLILLAIAIFASCGGGNNNTKNTENNDANTATKAETGKADSPDVVAENFYKAVMEYDFDKAAKYCTAETAAAIEESKKMMDQIPEDQLKMMKEATKLATMEVTDTQISEDGNSATVNLKVSAMGAENTLPVTLVKEGGKWKVDGGAGM